VTKLDMLAVSAKAGMAMEMQEEEGEGFLEGAALDMGGAEEAVLAMCKELPQHPIFRVLGAGMAKSLYRIPLAKRATTFLAPLASRVPATLTLQQELLLALLRVQAGRLFCLALRVDAKLAIMLRAVRVFYVLQAV